MAFKLRYGSLLRQGFNERMIFPIHRFESSMGEWRGGAIRLCLRNPDINEVTDAPGAGSHEAAMEDFGKDAMSRRF